MSALIFKIRVNKSNWWGGNEWTYRIFERPQGVYTKGMFWYDNGYIFKTFDINIQSYNKHILTKQILFHGTMSHYKCKLVRKFDVLVDRTPCPFKHKQIVTSSFHT